VERKSCHQGFCAFFKHLFKKLQKPALFLGKQISKIFVTIINGKQTTHKQLIVMASVYRRFTQINSAVKVRKTTAAFFASACGILRRLDFRRRALAPFIMRKINEHT
jgi:hypothetical protein